MCKALFETRIVLELPFFYHLRLARETNKKLLIVYACATNLTLCPDQAINVMSGLSFHPKRYQKRFFLVLLCLLVVFTFNASRSPSALEKVLESGVLQIITVPGSTTYYETGKGPSGFEYLLAKTFADSLGVELEVSTMKNLNGLLLAVGGPRGQLAAAGLVSTPEREQFLRFSDPYAEIHQQLIYRAGSKAPRHLDSLDGRLVVIANSSHATQLQKLSRQHPDLQWEERNDVDMLQLMQMVNDGEIDYAVVDEGNYLLDRNLYPKVRVAFNISDPQPLVWAFPKNNDDTLINAFNSFLQDYRASGELGRLIDRFLGHTERFSVPGSNTFLRRIETRLPIYRDLFEAAAEKYDLDWHLLAAIAYQESHWNRKAKSPTGVRGLMMLTRDTAKEMGIKDRLDAAQSLDGGTRYLLQTRERMPSDITEPDRTWLALAAYNVGMGHLEDARVLTERAGKNPDLWEDVRQFLPLLQQKKYYDTVKYGYARGSEPVQYVQNIRHYRSILVTHSRAQQQQPSKEPDLPHSSNLGSDSLLSL